jgi:hypothetical protein
MKSRIFARDRPRRPQARSAPPPATSRAPYPLTTGSPLASRPRFPKAALGVPGEAIARGRREKNAGGDSRRMFEPR